MAIGEFYDASKILIVAGKGGVGTTTVGATAAVAAARAGAEVLCIELGTHSSLGRPFGHGPLHHDPQVVARFADAGRVSARRLVPDRALDDYFSAHGLERFTRRIFNAATLDLVTNAAPGLRDLVLLGKLGQLERAAEADLIVVDAPAAGHALSFLRSPAGFADLVEGPIRAQADQVLEFLSDPARCQVALVTLPEETPVTEAIETAYSIEDLVGVQLAPVVVNALLAPIEGLAEAAASDRAEGAKRRHDRARRAAHHRLAHLERQADALARLRRELPLGVVELPRLATPAIDLDGLGELADAMDRGAT